MSETSPKTVRVRIWDLPTRIFHWVLVLAVAASVATAHVGGNAMEWHFRCGYLIFTLLAFRLLWGFVGGRWSRFSSFVYGPATVWRYLRRQGDGDGPLDTGHSPLGSLSVFALLLFLGAQVGSGLFADDEIATTGPLNKFVSNATGLLLSGYHADVGQWILVALVSLHVAAIVAYRWRLRKDLVGPMIRGDKLLPSGVPASRDTALTRALAVVLLTACAAVVACLVSLGG